jgi:hypothetical protein
MEARDWAGHNLLRPERFAALAGPFGRNQEARRERANG